MIGPWLALIPWRKIPWRKVLPGLAICAVVAAGGFAIRQHYSYVAGLEETVTTQAADLVITRAEIERMKAAQEADNERIEDISAKVVAAEELYRDLMAAPPERVIRWREKIVEVPMIITAEDCSEVLVQARSVVSDLGGWPAIDEGAP